MARPTKQGIDYFPVDVDLDEKHDLFVIETKGEGLGVLVTIWQMIYKNEGYYAMYNDDFLLLVKKRVYVDENLIDSYINTAVKRGIFNKRLFKKYNVLTSAALQKRYFEGAKKKKIVKIVREFILVRIESYDNVVNVGINSIDVGGNATNVEVEVEVKGEEEVEELIPPETHPLFSYWNSVLYTPRLLEQEFILDMIKRFGEDKAKENIRLFKQKGFKILDTMINSLDEHGDIKPKGKANERPPRGSIDIDKYAAEAATEQANPKVAPKGS